MIKKILLSSAVILLLTACSDKKEEKQVQETKTETVQQAPLKIEVEENKNAKEIKVEVKENKNNKNETYYFSYNGEKKVKAEEKPRTNIDANLHVRSPYERVKVSLLVKKLSKEFIVKCSACHNDYANGIIGPSLLDKDSDFIFNSIMKFKKDKNANVLMNGLVKQMDDEEIRSLANEIFEFNKQIRELK